MLLFLYVLFSIGFIMASHGITSWLFPCFQSLFHKTNHRICLEFKYVSTSEKTSLDKKVQHIFAVVLKPKGAKDLLETILQMGLCFEMYWVTCGWVRIFQHPKQCEIWRKEAHRSHKRLNITPSEWETDEWQYLGSKICLKEKHRHIKAEDSVCTCLSMC